MYPISLDGAVETDFKPLEEDLDFGELNLEQLDEKIEEEVFQEALEEHKKEQEKSASGGGSRGPQPPPFPELRSLNLSYNWVSLKVVNLPLLFFALPIHIF